MNPKKNLRNALRELSETKAFEDITVQMILDKADVSRGTFYKYYHDKYDLANAYYLEYVSENILTHYNGSNWAELLEQTLMFVKENYSFFQTVTKLGNYDFLQFVSDFNLKGYQMIYLTNVGRTKLSDQEVMESEFYNAGGLRLFQMWIEEGCKRDINELMHMILSLMPEKYINIKKN